MKTQAYLTEQEVYDTLTLGLEFKQDVRTLSVQTRALLAAVTNYLNKRIATKVELYNVKGKAV